MKRLAVWIQLLALSACTALAPQGKLASLPRGGNGAHEENVDRTQQKIGFLLLPVMVALLPLEIMIVSAQNHQPADRHPSSKSKSEAELPVNPLPQTS